jgi:metal-responsive CopG/Arc/MetJ family transcriptional regulator
MAKTNIPDGKTKISINIPERLLIELDNYREETKQDRSSWITSAIMEKIAIKTFLKGFLILSCFFSLLS